MSNKTLTPEQVNSLISYAPDDHPAKEQYINMVNTKILGTDKTGVPRPIEDLFYFLQVAKRTGLDPTMRQIYAVYRYNSRQGREIMTIQTGIDGLRSIAESTKGYGGSEDPKHVYNDDKQLMSSTVTVNKINPITGALMPTTATARWEEYYPGDSMGAMWKKMPHVMLDKCAEALALRKAFPICQGLYVNEEMEQANPLANLPAPTKKEVS